MEQTTPYTYVYNDNSASVSAISFADQDLDLGQLGGTVIWTPPADASLVTAYRMYLSTDDAGMIVVDVGNETPVGTNQALLPADTDIDTAAKLLVYTVSLLTEQTMPVSTAFADEVASVSNVSFADLDLDSGDLGGSVVWLPPSSVVQVTNYNVYLSEDLAGTTRTALAPPLSSSVGTNDVSIPAETSRENNSYWLVYTQSALDEQTTPVSNLIVDANNCYRHCVGW